MALTNVDFISFFGVLISVFTILFTMAATFTVHKCHNSALFFYLFAMLFIFLAILIFFIDAQFSWISLDVGNAAILLFLILIPLANVPLDWVSLSVSRALLGRIADGTHKGLESLLYALGDLILAVIFLGLVAATTAAVLALAETVHTAGGADPLFSTQNIIDTIRDPQTRWSADVSWIYLLLLTTLIPTLIHFLAAATLVLTSLIGGQFHIIQRTMEQARGGDSDAIPRAARCYALAQTASVGMALGLLWLAFYGVWSVGDDVGLALLTVVEGLVQWILSWAK